MKIRVLTGSLTRPMPQYEKADGQGVCGLTFNDAEGSLSPLFAEGRYEDILWIAKSADGRCFYTTHEIAGTDQSHVAAFVWDNAAKGLTYLGSQPTGGNEACHASLSEDGRFLLVANYNGEVFQGLPEQSVSAFPINPNGSLGAASASVCHEGSGPRADRQTRPHAHCALQRPGSSDIYVVDLGLDLVVVYALTQSGHLEHRAELDIRVQPGDGPRHVVFSRDGARMFIVCELEPKVLSYALDLSTGAARLVDEFAITSVDGSPAQPSGILLSDNASSLIIALRQCDQLLALAVQTDGSMTETGRWPCGGRTPRDIAFAGSDRRLLVANQDSSNISLFDIDPSQGRVLRLVDQFPIGTPMCMAVSNTESTEQAANGLTGASK